MSMTTGNATTGNATTGSRTTGSRTTGSGTTGRRTTGSGIGSNWRGLSWGLSWGWGWGWGLALAASLALHGCASDPTKGYSLQSTYRTDVRTVMVPIFENKTFERDLQFELADALIKEIEATTPWKVASGRTADTALEGSITEVSLRQLSRSRTTGLTQEGVVSLTVTFEWRDLRTGQPIVRRESFTASGLFHPSQGVGEPIEIGRYAAIQALARDIVSELRSPW